MCAVGHQRTESHDTLIVNWTGTIRGHFFQMKGQPRGACTMCRHPREHFVASFSNMAPPEGAITAQ